jgi:hypothetical protein
LLNKLPEFKPIRFLVYRETIFLNIFISVKSEQAYFWLYFISVIMRCLFIIIKLFFDHCSICRQFIRFYFTRNKFALLIDNNFMGLTNSKNVFFILTLLICRHYHFAPPPLPSGLYLYYPHSFNCLTPPLPLPANWNSPYIIKFQNLHKFIYFYLHLWWVLFLWIDILSIIEKHHLKYFMGIYQKAQNEIHAKPEFLGESFPHFAHTVNTHCRSSWWLLW